MQLSERKFCDLINCIIKRRRKREEKLDNWIPSGNEVNYSKKKENCLKEDNRVAEGKFKFSIISAIITPWNIQN